MQILVTGGAGYIGSHTCVELLNAGYDVIVVDNLYNSNQKAIDRIEQITQKKVKFYKEDILDKETARIKRLRPDIVKSWKSYQAFEKLCKDNNIA